MRDSRSHQRPPVAAFCSAVTHTQTNPPQNFPPREQTLLSYLISFISTTNNSLEFSYICQPPYNAKPLWKYSHPRRTLSEHSECIRFSRGIHARPRVQPHPTGENTEKGRHLSPNSRADHKGGVSVTSIGFRVRGP